MFAATLADGQGPFLRTGDLGFTWEGKLYITGRLKDTIIIRGRNLHPQDLERAAEAASASLRPGCSAAFSLAQEDKEVLILVAEAQGSEEELRAAREAVKQALVEEFQVEAEQIVFISPRTIPKTSSGKIQRYACREAFLQGSLEVVLGQEEPPRP